MAIGNDGRVTSADGRTSTLVGQNLEALAVNNGIPDTLLRSIDGRFTAASFRGSQIAVWRDGFEAALRAFSIPKNATYALSFSTDQRTLASAGRDGVVRLWDIDTGTLRREIRHEIGAIFALALSPDGRHIAFGGENRQLRIVDLNDRVGPVRFDPQRFWDALASLDAARAEAQSNAFFHHHCEAVALLEKRLAPIPPVDNNRLQSLVLQLDHTRYRPRHEAETELSSLGALAGPALRRAIAASPSLELRQRAERILRRLELEQPSTDELRADRAIELLA